MTEKRFTIQDERIIKDNQKYVTENGYILSYKSDAEEVCNLLNEFNEENEQLIQFKEDVFNKINMHLRRLPAMIDDEFDEYDGDPSLYVGAIEMLETLKKGLKE